MSLRKKIAQNLAQLFFFNESLIFIEEKRSLKIWEFSKNYSKCKIAQQAKIRPIRSPWLSSTFFSLQQVRVPPSFEIPGKKWFKVSTQKDWH
jgi:hypothetical protein